MLTMQQIFDKVSHHLLTQNAKAMGQFKCMYRTSNGLMCAVGCLIPDELYDPSLESWIGSDPAILDVLKKANVLSEDVTSNSLMADFFLDLQELHDHSRPEDWQKNLNSLAEGRGLTPYALQEKSCV